MLEDIARAATTAAPLLRVLIKDVGRVANQCALAACKE